MRYVLGPTRSADCDDGYYSPPLMITPEVDARKEIDTGLVTLRGQKIFRIQPPVGFGRDKEW